MGNNVFNGAGGGSIGETRVTVFRNVMSNGNKELSVEERCQLYSASKKEPYEMTLYEFLNLGERYLEIIQRLRSCEDKETRNKIKRTELPCATISARLFQGILLRQWMRS